MITAHYVAGLLDSIYPPTSAFQLAGTEGGHHHAWLFFLFFLETESLYVALVGLEPLCSSNPLALASPGAEIVSTSHPYMAPECSVFFLFLRRSFTLVTQTGGQWCNLGSPQPPPPGFKRFPCLSLLSSCDYRLMSPCPANFCIFSRGRVLPCWPGWSPTPDLMIRPPWPPKGLGLQV